LPQLQIHRLVVETSLRMGARRMAVWEVQPQPKETNDAATKETMATIIIS